ncbi:MAG TPA: M23 family metallopeptidase [Thermoanaerobaculia bacterium]|nr:M23 family metallopeptidase [Thermoanaerobaculia bacterium]
MTLLGVLALAGGITAGDCRAPRLSVSLSPASVRQGGIVVAALTSDAPLDEARVFAGEREIVMEAERGGRRFRALVGVDFESAVGKRALRFEGRVPCGEKVELSRELRVRSGKFAVEKLKVAPEYVEPPESEKARIESDREKVALVWKSFDPERRWSGPFLLPVDAPVRRESFGSRRVLNGESRSAHSGLDLAAASGQPVRAPAPARVALAEDLYFSGGTVILDHGERLFTSYFHLSRIDVKEGQVLETGEAFAAVGATGRATGPHLHWSAKIAGARINPLGLLELPKWPLVPAPLNLTSQSQ